MDQGRNPICQPGEVRLEIESARPSPGAITPAAAPAIIPESLPLSPVVASGGNDPSYAHLHSSPSNQGTSTIVPGLHGSVRRQYESRQQGQSLAASADEPASSHSSTHPKFRLSRPDMKSNLAERFRAIDGVTTVFFEDSDMLLIHKRPDVSWAVLQPRILTAMVDHFSSGGFIPCNASTLAASDTAPDPETAATIKELLKTRREALEKNDGYIFKCFAEDNVTVKLDADFILLHYVAMLGHDNLGDALKVPDIEHERYTRVAKYLVHVKKHPVFVEDKYGCTPLQLAAACGNVDMVKTLLESLTQLRRDYLNHQDDQIWFTALHGAVSHDKHEVVVWLLHYGANPEVLDVTRKTAFEVAPTLSSLQELLEMVVEHVGEVPRRVIVHLMAVALERQIKNKLTARHLWFNLAHNMLRKPGETFRAAVKAVAMIKSGTEVGQIVSQHFEDLYKKGLYGNLCDYVTLAIRSNNSKLTEIMIDLICEKCPKVLGQPQWHKTLKRLVSSYPTLFHRLLTRLQALKFEHIRNFVRGLKPEIFRDNGDADNQDAMKQQPSIRQHDSEGKHYYAKTAITSENRDGKVEGQLHAAGRLKLVFYQQLVEGLKKVSYRVVKTFFEELDKALLNDMAHFPIFANFVELMAKMQIIAENDDVYDSRRLLVQELWPTPPGAMSPVGSGRSEQSQQAPAAASPESRTQHAAAPNTQDQEHTSGSGGQQTQPSGPGGPSSGNTHQQPESGPGISRDSSWLQTLKVEPVLHAAVVAGRARNVEAAVSAITNWVSTNRKNHKVVFLSGVTTKLVKILAMRFPSTCATLLNVVNDDIMDVLLTTANMPFSSKHKDHVVRCSTVRNDFLWREKELAKLVNTRGYTNKMVDALVDYGVPFECIYKAALEVSLEHNEQQQNGEQQPPQLQQNGGQQPPHPQQNGEQQQPRLQQNGEQTLLTTPEHFAKLIELEFLGSDLKLLTSNDIRLAEVIRYLEECNKLPRAGVPPNFLPEHGVAPMAVLIRDMLRQKLNPRIVDTILDEGTMFEATKYNNFRPGRPLHTKYRRELYDPKYTYHFVQMLLSSWKEGIKDDRGSYLIQPWAKEFIDTIFEPNDPLCTGLKNAYDNKLTDTQVYIQDAEPVHSPKGGKEVQTHRETTQTDGVQEQQMQPGDEGTVLEPHSCLMGRGMETRLCISKHVFIVFIRQLLVRLAANIILVLKVGSRCSGLSTGTCPNFITASYLSKKDGVQEQQQEPGDEKTLLGLYISKHVFIHRWIVWLAAHVILVVKARLCKLWRAWKARASQRTSGHTAVHLDTQPRIDAAVLTFPILDFVCPEDGGDILTALVFQKAPCSWFQYPIVRALYGLHWRTFGRMMILLDVLAHLLLASTFMVFFLLVRRYRPHPAGSKDTLSWFEHAAAAEVFLFAAVMLSLSMLCERLLELWLTLRCYSWVTFSLYIDVACYALVVSVAAMTWSGLPDCTVLPWSGITMLLMVGRLALFGLVTETLCTAVLALLEILSRSKFFFLLIALVYSGFVLAAAGLRLKDESDGYSSLLFGVLLGDFESGDLKDPDTDTDPTQTWRNFSAVVLSFYGILMLIVFMNLLIATMNDTYDMVKEFREVEVMRLRSHMMVFVKHKYHGCFQSLMEGDVLHLLLQYKELASGRWSSPSTANPAEFSAWAGRLTYIRTAITQAVGAKVRRETDHRLEQLSEKQRKETIRSFEQLSELQRRETNRSYEQLMKQQLAGIEERMKKQEQQLDGMKDYLGQQLDGIEDRLMKQLGDIKQRMALQLQAGLEAGSGQVPQQST